MGAISGRSMGTTPVPMTTPTRSGFSWARSSPLSVTASPAATTPKRAARPMILRLLRCGPGTKGVMSSGGTSAAIRTGCAEASNVEIGRTPLLPLTQADQKASLPMPLGATTPRPVTTTLRISHLRATHGKAAGTPPAREEDNRAQSRQGRIEVHQVQPSRILLVTQLYRFPYLPYFTDVPWLDSIRGQIRPSRLGGSRAPHIAYRRCDRQVG